MKTIEFTITLQGTGDTIDDAWRDACEGFSQDWGDTPESFKIVEEDDNDYYIKVMTLRLAIYANNHKNSTQKETQGKIWKEGNNHYLQIGSGKIRYLREETYKKILAGKRAEYNSEKYRCEIWTI